MSDLLTRQLGCPPCHLPPLLDLPSHPSVASAVGSWTQLSVARNKLAGELWLDLNREGTTVGRLGPSRPSASQQVPVILHDWAEFLCVGSKGSPSRNTVRREARHPLLLTFSFHTRVLIRAADHQLHIPESIYRMLGTLLDNGGNEDRQSS